MQLNSEPTNSLTLNIIAWLKNVYKLTVNLPRTNSLPGSVAANWSINGRRCWIVDIVVVN